MASKMRKPMKSKSSKNYCQEMFSCQGVRTEAEYECEQCETYQCAACETKLHGFHKFVFHDRKRIAPTDSALLCQMPCEDMNYADVRCENCLMNFCHDCNEKMHGQGKRKKHKRMPFNPVNKDATQSISVAADCQDQLVFDPDKFSSPFSLSDDSNMFLSMPKDHTSDTIVSSSVSDKSDSSRPSIPDVATLSSEVDLISAMEDIGMDDTGQSSVLYRDCSSFVLADDQEKLKVTDGDELVKKLKCGKDSLVKVVSIFGNTGDGKSHTLNHTFFNGKEVFKTSSDQASGTAGIWAAYDPVHNAVIVDTEGLLGVSSNHNQRTRLLLKVLAASDVVIYRTRADRLHNDLFHFLADASKAYLKHFTVELKAASQRCNMDVPISSMGPSVIIFHETQHTAILGAGGNSRKKKTADVLLKERIRDLGLSMDAFSALEYVGTRTNVPPTDFKPLLRVVKMHLRNTSVRSPRHPKVMLNTIQVLNEKFKGDIDKEVPNTFPDEYFTCSTRCLSCNMRCLSSMNHAKDGLAHSADSRCFFQHQFDNRIFTCKKCWERGQEVVVVPKVAEARDNTWLGLAKYAWSGYVLECAQCGIIYRSRQYWYGNEDPVDTVVRTEIRHVWPGSNPVLQGTHNAARRLLDGIHYVSDTVGSISAKPAKYLSSWMADQIAPPYWKPNNHILLCGKCKYEFQPEDTKHHCRACGDGFCDDCSSKKKPVPELGWGAAPVRVCDDCYGIGGSIQSSSDTQVTARKVGEVVTNTLGVVASAVDYPLDVLKDSARPTYWVPDTEISHCVVCEEEFNPKLKIHHCRGCGQGVCDPCSPRRFPVPSRGWDHPVRVCNSCAKKDDL